MHLRVALNPGATPSQLGEEVQVCARDNSSAISLQYHRRRTTAITARYGTLRNYGLYRNMPL
jgi:hypothetical protein